MAASVVATVAEHLFDAEELNPACRSEKSG